MKIYQTDVVVIGAGAIGSAIARELSKYELDVMLVEKREDVGGDASKSNSATIVSGYDAPVGSLESYLAVHSNPMFDQVTQELDVDFKRIGAIQAGFTDEDVEVLKENKRKAIANGVMDVQLLSGDAIRRLEPSLSKEIKAGLLIPREGIVNVFDLLIAYVENAVDNGVRLLTSTKAGRITAENGAVRSVVTDRCEIQTKYVINAAALYCDELADTVGKKYFRNYPRKGEFYVLDKNLPYATNHVIAPIPTPLTRGKLITPTMEGNLLLGPTAVNLEDKEDKSTTRDGLSGIIKDIRKLLPQANPQDAITQFAGLRPARDPAEYSIRSFDDLSGYIEVNGISQGVSCSLAAAVYVTELLEKTGLELVRKKNYNPYRKRIRLFRECSREEQAELVREDPRYGNIICRCEIVTEAEICEAVRRGARTVDGIKYRLRAGMGRCQGGFCGPRVVEILARELEVDPSEICKNEKGSELLAGRIK